MKVTCPDNGCEVNLSSACVFYEGESLIYTGINTNDSVQTVIQKFNTFLESTPSGGGVWGTITGDIEDQSDLIAYTTFQTNFTVSLSGGKTFGKYLNGETVPAAGLTAIEVILDAAIEYINPAFSSFSISGQSTTVEVGTTLSGSKTFTWAITENSGNVDFIDIYDVTNATNVVVNTPNDGTQAETITSGQLNSNGATRAFRGVLHDTVVVQNINSSNFTVTSRYYRFFGPSASSPANSAAVRALPSSAFHTGATTFTLATGSTLTKFVVALPPSVTISSVIDTSALNADITSDYILTGTVNVLDAGGTNRSYNIYEMNIGVPYASSHNHSITTSN